MAIYREGWELGLKKRQHLFAATHSLWRGISYNKLSLFVFSLDVLREMKGLSPENDDCVDGPDESFISADNDPSIEGLFQEQSLETQTSCMTDGHHPVGKKETKKLKKQVSWNDRQSTKDKSSHSDSDSSEEDENISKPAPISEKRSSEVSASCNCDGEIALDDQVENKAAENQTAIGSDQAKGKEKDVEPGKFDGVFSDTDDSEGSEERYK